jgi:hypothetical protein
MAHAVTLVVTDDLRRNRLTVFFRFLLAIPHVVWLALWGIVATLASVVAWFAALFTRRVPTGLHDFLARYVRYQVHVYAYVTLTANPYPGFAGADVYPVDVRIAAAQEQARIGVFFRFLLALPALVASYVMNYLVEVLVVFGWFASLVLGRMPMGMRNLLAFTIRYHAQTQAYISLVTAQYPSFNVGLT